MRCRNETGTKAMARVVKTAAFSLAATLLLGACHSSASSPSPPAAPANTASAVPAAAVPAPPPPPGDAPGRVGGGGGAGGGSGSGSRRSAAFLYLDGQPLAAIQFGELPPQLVTAWERIPGLDQPVRRFSLAAYLGALGIDLKTARAVHLHSGRRRVATLTGADLIASPDTYFAFTRGTSGKLHMRWPTSSVTNDRIDKVGAIAVYVEKKPPTRDSKTGFLWLDGEEVDEPPYVTADVQGGTRLYVDGRLARVLRPRDLEGGEGPRPFLAELARLGVDVSAVKSADLIHNDALVKRLSGASLQSASFAIPTGAGGISRFGDDQASAILVAVKSPPTDWATR